uniref:Aspartate--tRNA ligase, cytoplasmic n=1 Tax=Ditylenchus dipsaci TaxID=166011 RepID=A0A915DBU2_9BILA
MSTTSIFGLKRMVPRYKNFLFRRFSPAKSSEDVSEGKYGPYGLIQSDYAESKVQFTNIKELDSRKRLNEVWIRGRLHLSEKTSGKRCFITLRQQIYTIQGVVSANAETTKEFVDFVASVNKESIVDVLGEVQIVKEEVRSCSQSDVELHIKKLFVVSSADSCLPMQIQQATRPDGDNNGLPSVNLHFRLNNRVLDLRAPTSQAIFKVQAGICQVFRDSLSKRGFVEIHTPKMVSAASEGGAEVFQIKYFEDKAYLAQSPQFYKQMAIAGDFGRVFTVGAVFRAENSSSNRHLTEFVGLDLEMTFSFHYHEVLRAVWSVIIELFKHLQDKFAEEISIIAEQYPSDPFIFSEQPVILTFAEAVAMLRDHGMHQDHQEDLGAPNERFLGDLVRAKYGTDFFVLDKFPLAVRPFYTMPDPNNELYSNSYDMFMRGKEILSGGQRIHDAKLLTERAKQHGIDLRTIQAYLDAFKYGCPPHAGGGIGLERITMLFLGLKNIRLASLFPRDPNRLPKINYDETADEKSYCGAANSRQSGRLLVNDQYRVVDEATKKRRLQKHLDTLERDNVQDDPHANLTWNKAIPKFADELSNDKTKRKKHSDTQQANKLCEVGTKKGKKLRAELQKSRFRKNFIQLIEEEQKLKEEDPRQ